jgi:2-polyprenyl-3-methyl-5-hydroxy-6-metoxy-1,4-benzoquinol methylase
VKALDRFLQRWRIAKARRYIPTGACVLDLGCADGALFRQLRPHLSKGVGIDPNLNHTVHADCWKLIAGRFPEDLGDEGPFDVITMLAVLEHIPPRHQHQLAIDCARLLKPGGCIVITVPAPSVDRILGLLKMGRLIDGMSLEEHYGFNPSDTASIFSVGGLRLATTRKFQLGLNNLYVFQKI